MAKNKHKSKKVNGQEAGHAIRKTLQKKTERGGKRAKKVASKAPKKQSAMAEEYRKFDERMASKRRPKEPSAPAVHIAAPTFQLQAPKQQVVQEPSSDFVGFMSTMQAPKDATAPPPRSKPQNSKPANPFMLLHDGADPDEEEIVQQKAAEQAQRLLQPATFSFGAPAGEEIDPDL